MVNKQSKKETLERTTELLTGEVIVEVDIAKLEEFINHPFAVKMDENLQELLASIKKNGIINPLLVTPTAEGTYQIISGHRRKRCAEMLGIEKVPVIIRFLKHEQAVIEMVDSNLHRQRISFSEKAFALKMKNEAMKKLGCSSGKTREKGVKTVDLIGEETGDSARQVTRYIRLTNLIPELLKKMDDGELGFNPGVDLSFLKTQEQKWVLDAMEYTDSKPNLSKTHRLKEMSQAEGLSYEEVLCIIKGEKPNADRIIFTSEELYQFFPKNYNPQKIKKEIVEMLKTVRQEGRIRNE